MKEILLIKNGEIALKGQNRSQFEDALVRILKKRLADLGPLNIRKAQSTIVLEPQSEDYDFEEALTRVGRVFGIAGYSRAAVCQKDMDDLCTRGVNWLKPLLAGIRTFKVESKRADKTFPLTSPEISAQLGGAILAACPRLKVDVHAPDVTIVAEVREGGIYLRAGQQPGAGGMPTGTGGRAAVLLSGGIDSPVAAWMMAKRGIELYAVHFASPPYTGPLAEQKVVDLLGQISLWVGPVTLAIVPFTHIQEEIRDRVPEEYFTLVMRRFMMKIASRIAAEKGCGALVTGESVGQVASQTLAALQVTDRASDLLVLRPLIGMDKEEIVRIARKIDTFDTSILPYEDCCTVFTPRHPRTRPTEEAVLAAQRELDEEGLIAAAIAGVRTLRVGDTTRQEVSL